MRRTGDQVTLGLRGAGTAQRNVFPARLRIHGGPENPLPNTAPEDKKAVLHEYTRLGANSSFRHPEPALNELTILCILLTQHCRAAAFLAASAP
jgi:hypothetical protein